MCTSLELQRSASAPIETPERRASPMTGSAEVLFVSVTRKANCFLLVSYDIRSISFLHCVIFVLLGRIILL